MKNSNNHPMMALGLALGFGLLNACGDEFTDAGLPIEGSTESLIVNDPTFTGWSGNGGSRTFVMSRATTRNDAMVGFTMGERSDDPCYLDAIFDDLDGGASANPARFDKCVGSERSLKTARLKDGYFATGIQVCLNRGEDKVKGIRLFGRKDRCLRDPDASFDVTERQCTSFQQGGVEYSLCSDVTRTVSCQSSYGTTTASRERTNCRDWQAAQHCPEGTVANMLTLHERDGGGSREMFDGIKLTCNPVY